MKSLFRILYRRLVEFDLGHFPFRSVAYLKEVSDLKVKELCHNVTGKGFNANIEVPDSPVKVTSGQLKFVLDLLQALLQRNEVLIAFNSG